MISKQNAPQPEVEEAQEDAPMGRGELKVHQVILAGMSTNLCVENPMRAFLEQGVEMALMRDGTAGAKAPEGEGYLAALVNFRMIANALLGTAEAIQRIAALSA